MRFVTTVSESYVPGLVALLGSMVRNSGIDFSFSIICYDKLSDQSSSQIHSTGVPIEWFNAQDLGTIEGLKSPIPRMIPCFQKPVVWNLPYEGEQLVYVDSDVLCLSSLAGIESWTGQSVVALNPKLYVGQENVDTPAVPPGSEWNAGIFGFSPDPNTFAEIRKFSAKYTDPVDFGDQPILNDFFRGQVNYKGLAWNTSVRVFLSARSVFLRTNVKFLHFAQDEKPWMQRPSERWHYRFWYLWKKEYDLTLQSIKRRNTVLSAPIRTVAHTTTNVGIPESSPSIPAIHIDSRSVNFDSTPQIAETENPAITSDHTDAISDSLIE